MASEYSDGRVYEAGDIIFEEGDKGSDMFIVQAGSVIVTKKILGKELVLGTVERGDFFGEISLLESVPRTATCRAAVSTTLKAIRTGELVLKIRRDPTFAVEMLQRMSRRIRYMDDRLAQLIASGQISQEELQKAALASDHLPRETI
jgi:CRP/FNR family cyclic AMP-dependent transcriptional regulator